MQIASKMNERIFVFILFIWLGRCSDSTKSTILNNPVEEPELHEVGVNFAERESGPNPGRRNGAEEGHFLRVVSRLQNQSLSSGEKAQFKCKVEGFPKDNLQFTWYRSNDVIDVKDDDRFSIRQKDGTSRFQIRDVYTADSGTYRCEASNGFRRVDTTATLKVEFLKPPPLEDGEVTPLIPKGKCERYEGLACRTFLANKYVFVDPFQTQEQIENSITSALTRITDPKIISDSCQKYAVPAFCYYVFPVCEEEDEVISTLRGKKKPEERAARLCREDCELLRNDFCKHEIFNTDDDDIIVEIASTANCSSLPPTTSRGSSCKSVGVPSVVDRKHTCYNETGVDYKGTETKTLSGITCKSWPLHMVEKHLELSGGHNFCRNPGNLEKRPWCFIDAARQTREICDISKCAVSSAGSGLVTILIPSVTVPLFILCVVGVFFFCCRDNKRGRSSKGIPGKQVLGGSSLQTLEMTLAPKPISKIPHINPQNLQFTMDLGEGQFGKAYKAQLTQNMNYNSNFPVAVKTLNDGAMPSAVDEFQREMEKFSELQHPNVACLKAVVIQPTCRCMVFEYTNRVDLHEYLSFHSPHSDVVVNTKMSGSASSQTSSSLEPHDFISMMTQIASGMDYLTSRNYFHRDLAARNVLVCQNNVLKICNLDVVKDCHLSCYYRSPQGGRMLPIRWMAPECIAHNVYSAKTAVWSFGVLVWEIYSYGMQPYCGYSNQEVLEMVTHFQLLSCPDQCPARVYSLMRECWGQDSASRPTFKEIYAKLCGWDNSNNTRMTSQLARGVHRQVSSLIKESHYSQYPGIDSSLPSYNTPSPPPTYNAVTESGINCQNQHQMHPAHPAAPNVSPASNMVLGQSSASASSAAMYAGQRLVVDMPRSSHDGCLPPQNHPGCYEGHPQRYYSDHQSGQMYMGGNTRRPGTQSSRSTSSCASSCSEYGPVSMGSSAGHSYGHPQQNYQYGGQQQHQKFYGGIDHQPQHYHQQNIPQQTYRRPLSGVVEDESGLDTSRNTHIPSSTAGPSYTTNRGFSNGENRYPQHNENIEEVNTQSRGNDEQTLQGGNGEKEPSKSQNEETESSSSSGSAKAPSCDSGLPVEEDADVNNQSTSVTLPLIAPKPYIPRAQPARVINPKSP